MITTTQMSDTPHIYYTSAIVVCLDHRLTYSIAVSGVAPDPDSGLENPPPSPPNLHGFFMRGTSQVHLQAPQDNQIRCIIPLKKSKSVWNIWEATAMISTLVTRLTFGLEASGHSSNRVTSHQSLLLLKSVRPWFKVRLRPDSHRHSLSWNSIWQNSQYQTERFEACISRYYRRTAQTTSRDFSQCSRRWRSLEREVLFSYQFYPSR
jgi:hypothetical protein